MPLAYDQNLISASSSAGIQLDLDLVPDGHHSRLESIIDPDELPDDPKHAVWALATQNKRLPQKAFLKHSHSHQHPATAPIVSTFSASNMNHIHIVQPYVPQNPSSDARPATTHVDAAASNGCSTSTFSVHPTGAPTPYSFSNPYCTNKLHSMLPAAGSAGAGAPGQPPRPANAWILYRSDKMKDITPSAPGQPRPPQADISKLIAAMWKAEQPEIRQKYEALSDMKKAEHLALYPGYRFQPVKKADKEKVKAERKAEREKERLAAAVKSSRRPKGKRAATEESIPEESNAFGWQEHQVHPTSPLSSTRTRAFAYQPYSIPSPSPASPAMTNGQAPVKRRRAHTKVEASTPALATEDAVSTSYVHVPQRSLDVTSSFFETQGDRTGNHFDQGYHSPLGPHHGYSTSTPQLSVGSNSDTNSHPTPPYPAVGHHNHNMLGVATATPPNAIQATLESIGGQHDIFQFTDFDAAHLLDGGDIDVTLPSDFNFDLVGGLGLGLADGGIGHEGESMGFAEFGNLASGDGGGFHDYPFADKGPGQGQSDGLVFDSGAYGHNVQYAQGYTSPQMDAPAPQPQRLQISTQGLQPLSSDASAIPMSAASDHYSLTSPSDAMQANNGYYAPFAPQNYGPTGQYQEYPPQQMHHYDTTSYGGPHDGFHGTFLTSPPHHLTSPTHSMNYSSPRPISGLDDDSLAGTPTVDAFPSVSSPHDIPGTSRGGAAKWR